MTKQYTVLAVKGGRTIDSPRSRITHIILEGSRAIIWGHYAALCGTRPGIHGVGWRVPGFRQQICSKCQIENGKDS